MPKEVKELVDDTVDLIKDKLLSDQPDTPEAIEEILNKCFKDAFSQVAEEDYKLLYKKLSLQFHPDRFKSAQPEIFAYLEKYKAIPLAQQSLENFKDPNPNLFQNMASDPVNGTKNFLSYLWEKFAGMLFEYERYPQPLRLMVNILHWTIGIALVAGLIVLAIPMAGIYFGIIWPVINMEKLFVSLITDFQFDAELKNFANDPDEFAEAKKNYISVNRAFFKLMQPEKAELIDAMTDDEIYKVCIEANYQDKLKTNYPLDNATAEDEIRLRKEAEAEIEAEIRGIIPQPTGFDKIALQAKALAYAIASPLPDNVGLQILQVVFIKPLQVLILPVVLIASVLIETIRLLYTAAIFAAMGIAVALGVAVLAITNLPLYMIDAVNSCAECCEGNDEESGLHNENEARKGSNKAPMKDLFDSKYGSEKLQPEPKEQGSYAKLFKSQPSNDGTFDVNPKHEASQPSM